MEWYEYNEEERIKNVYSKYTIEDFWNWWSSFNNQVMEVRIKDWAIIKQVANKYKLPYSYSGVYVCSHQQLKAVIAFVRDKATIWFGINSRKKNYNKKGWKVFEGKDVNVDSVEFIFIDIDRINKEDRQASKQELKNCDDLANLIIERLKTQGFDKNYCKICSGNGLQLLIKLDIPIKLPNLIFDNKNNIYEPNTEFEKVKILIRNGIGKQIKTFCDKYEDSLQVEFDKTGFNMGRVAALPVTKNFKYNGFTWRGIVELKNEENVGLTDYILTFEDDKETFKINNIFRTKNLTRQNIIRVGKLKEHPLARFLLDNKFTMGGINNTLWFQLKCLLRDSNFNFNSKEFITYHNQIKQKHNRTFTLNIPDNNYRFEEGAVNNFCIFNGYKPVFDLWSTRTKKLDMKLENMKWENKNITNMKIIIQKNTNIFDDMKKVKEYLKEGDFNNLDVIGGFINACIEKYGEEKTRFWFENIFYKYFTFI